MTVKNKGNRISKIKIKIENHDTGEIEIREVKIPLGKMKIKKEDWEIKKCHLRK